VRCTDGIHAGSAEMKSLSGISLSLHSSLPKPNPNEDIESFDAYGAHHFTIVSFLLLLRSVVFRLSLIMSTTMFAAVQSGFQRVCRRRPRHRGQHSVPRRGQIWNVTEFHEWALAKRTEVLHRAGE